MARTSKLTTTDSELLLQFSRNGDQDAFAELMRRHSGVVLGVCSSVLRNPADAEDACQETFLTLARRADSVRVRSSVGGWLYRVACRVSVRLAKQRRVPDELDDPESTDECPLEIVARRELTHLLIEEVSNLSPRYRDVVVLCHLRGLERAEAAEHLECTVDAVKARLVRARRKLRLRLASRGVAFTFGMGLLTAACQKAAHADLITTVMGNVSPPTPSTKATDLLEELTTMKITVVTSCCVLLVATLIGLWPATTEGSGSDEILIRASASEDAGGEARDDQDQATNIARTTAASTPATAPPQGAAVDERRMNFEKQSPGQTPQYWKKISGSGSWKITNAYATSGVSAVEYEGDVKSVGEHSVLVLSPDHVQYEDLDLSIRIRLKQALPGTGGGVVWNYRDKKNYNLAVLHNNGKVDVSCMKQGKLELLASVSSSAGNASNANWRKLRVVHVGAQASIFVDDARVLALRMPNKHGQRKVGMVSTAARIGVDDFWVRKASVPSKNATSRNR